MTTMLIFAMEKPQMVKTDDKQKARQIESLRRRQPGQNANLKDDIGDIKLLHCIDSVKRE